MENSLLMTLRFLVNLVERQILVKTPVAQRMPTVTCGYGSTFPAKGSHRKLERPKADR
jgi:hypothetical protein